MVTHESKIEKSPYVQMPLAAVWTNGENREVVFDFRETLTDTTGNWADIRNLFLDQIQFGITTWVNNGNYGKGQFVMRIRRPTKAGT